MDNTRTARQATHWELRGYKRKPGQPRKNCVDVITHQTRPQEYGRDLERSRETGKRQSTMASTCGPMQPSGCGM